MHLHQGAQGTGTVHGACTHMRTQDPGLCACLCFLFPCHPSQTHPEAVRVKADLCLRSTSWVGSSFSSLNAYIIFIPGNLFHLSLTSPALLHLYKYYFSFIETLSPLSVKYSFLFSFLLPEFSPMPHLLISLLPVFSCFLHLRSTYLFSGTSGLIKDQ